MSIDRVRRQLKKSGMLLHSPKRVAKVFRDSLHQEFSQRTNPSPLPVVPLSEILRSRPSIRLVELSLRNGNVSLAEIATIAAIVAESKARSVLEIGTFDGNTSLQIAANIPVDGMVYTLDLPTTNAEPTRRIEIADQQFIDSEFRSRRRYIDTEFEKKVTQLEGDSATFDFAHALGDRLPTLVFIDGSHSYDYVKSDTERVLKLIAPGGHILWHDYTPAWPGVIQYLGELRQQLPVIRIAETTLAYAQLPKA